MSLRKALLSLSDDASTRHTVSSVIAFMDLHQGEPIEAPRLCRATGLDVHRVEPVLDVLAQEHVIDCDGDPHTAGCVFAPDSVLSLEVRRFLRSGTGEARLHRGIDRYRGRFGTNL